MRNKVIDQWFFIRYADPDHHLRVRFKISNIDQLPILNTQLYQPLRLLYKQGLINKIVEDSYVPEISRYGGFEILPICEELFYLNSVMITDFISTTLLNPDKNELRWKISLHLAWKVTLGVSDDLLQMEQFYKNIASAYDDEFVNNSTVKKKISQNYRQSMKDVAQCLSPNYYQSNNENINQKNYTSV